MILNEKNLTKYLKKKSIDLDSKPVIKKLPGGWLNPIFLVKSKNKSFVVKQILSKGKKGGGFEDFYFPRDRMLNEYYSLIISNIYTPENVPAILNVDFENFVILIEYLDNSILLEEMLKKKKMNFETADSIVKFLIKLHNNTINDKMVEIMVSHDSYWPLKYEYQYLRADCSKEVKERLKKFVKDFQNRKQCLVHGDFNTKNILVKPNNSIVAIDFEETGYSDPAHDIGTILAHLIIFHYVYNTVDKKEIHYIFDEYIKNINFKNKEELKKSIIIHTASIILTRLKGKLMLTYKFIPKDIKLKLKELSESAILKEANNINIFF